MNHLTTEKISYFCGEVFDFFILNICWISGTLLGGLIFGYAPSTIALFTVLRDKIMAAEKRGVASTYWMIYKKEFKKGNLLGMIVTLFACVIYINQANFKVDEDHFFVILTTISTMAQWLLILVILYLFPMYVHYETTLTNYIRFSFSFVFLKPHITFFLALWCWLIYSLFVIIPGLIPFFGVSLLAFGIMAINYQLFMRNETDLRANSSKTS